RSRRVLAPLRTARARPHLEGCLLVLTDRLQSPRSIQGGHYFSFFRQKESPGPFNGLAKCRDSKSWLAGEGGCGRLRQGSGKSEGTRSAALGFDVWKTGLRIAV